MENEKMKKGNYRLALKAKNHNIHAFGRNYRLASEKFKTAIDEARQNRQNDEPEVQEFYMKPVSTWGRSRFFH